jgi:L-2-hydroxyglutarate oxidase LhgO
MSVESFETECVIVGAGVVGLACAADLSRRGRDVLVVEAAGAIGTGVSARNSEVIHAGLYYPTGSLKHELCVRGRRLLYPYLAERNVAHRKCGKLIVASSADEGAQLDALFERARANGVENVSRLSAAEACALEPNVTCASALLSAETGILDCHGLMLALLYDLESAGGALALNAPLLRGECGEREGFTLEIGGAAPARIRCRALINAGGLGAQAVARSLDGLPSATIPKQVLAKGSYFGCAGKPAFTRLIYPAPVEGGLGVHLTLDLGGRMRFGPDVEWLAPTSPGEIDYAVDQRRADSFYAAIRRYWPALPEGALTADCAGCRPKLSGPGEPASDFRIDGPQVHGVAGLVNLYGIESPGLTSSLAIAEAAANMINSSDA